LILDAIEEDIGELINIHLLGDICGVAIIIFKSITELLGNVELPVTVLQI
jgi:hypothetical protein